MSSTEWKELNEELVAMLSPLQWLALKRAGHAWSLSVRDYRAGSSNAVVTNDKLRNVVVTDEQLLAKLRSIKGQFVYEGLPVFFYEYCDSAHSEAEAICIGGHIYYEINGELVMQLGRDGYPFQCPKCRK
jgi:hypothetical protein